MPHTRRPDAQRRPWIFALLLAACGARPQAPPPQRVMPQLPGTTSCPPGQEQSASGDCCCATPPRAYVEPSGLAPRAPGTCADAAAVLAAQGPPDPTLAALLVSHPWCYDSENGGMVAFGSEHAQSGGGCWVLVDHTLYTAPPGEEWAGFHANPSDSGVQWGNWSLIPCPPPRPPVDPEVRPE